MQETLDIPDIGLVTFVKSNRVKRVRISIKPMVGVKITFPTYVSQEKAYTFLMKKKAWIVKNKAKINTLESGYTIFDEDTFFETKHRVLQLIAWDKHSFKTSIDTDSIEIKYPVGTNLKATETQKRIRKAIEKVWKMEAEEYLIPLTYELAKEFKFPVQSITIKNVLSKWGSCSYKNEIIYSLHIMRLPLYLQKYVVLHELCHTKEKNHQAPFWNLMDKVSQGKAKQWDKELKGFSTKIY